MRTKCISSLRVSTRRLANVIISDFSNYQFRACTRVESSGRERGHERVREGTSWSKLTSQFRKLSQRRPVSSGVASLVRFRRKLSAFISTTVFSPESLSLHAVDATSSALSVPSYNSPRSVRGFGEWSSARESAASE